MDKCLLCSQGAITTRQDNSSRTIYNCGNCGVYVVSDLALKPIKHHINEVSAYLRHMKISNSSDTVLISFNKAKLDKSYLQLTVDQIVERFPRTISEQMSMALINLSMLSKYPGDEIRIETLDSAPVFYMKAINFDALSFIIKAMVKEELIEVSYYGSAFFPCGVIVSPKGWDMLDKLSRREEDNATQRVTLLYNPSMEESESFCSAAQRAARECGMKIVSSDILAGVGAIGNQIAANINMCSHVFIELSDAQPETFYSWGYAKALKKPLILLCNEKERKKLKIDVTKIGVTFWQDEKQLQLELYNFLKANG